MWELHFKKKLEMPQRKSSINIITCCISAGMIWGLHTFGKVASLKLSKSILQFLAGAT